MFSVDGAVFLNTYKDLRSLEPTPPTGFPLVIGNLLTARTSGLELTTEFEPAERWRLHGGYTFLHERFRLRPESRDAFNGTNEYNDPRHQFWLRSYFNPADNIELDATMRSVASLPHPSVPAYTELTLHFGWRFAGGFDLSLIGDNLLHDRHPEFGALNPRPEFRRSFFAQATWAF
jgi:iron complex outermembrane receptor protein